MLRILCPFAALLLILALTAQAARADCLFNGKIRTDIADGANCLEAQRTGCVSSLLTDDQLQDCQRVVAKAKADGKLCVINDVIYNEYNVAGCEQAKAAADSPSQADSGEDPNYPVVFNDQAVLAETGIVIVNYGRENSSVQHTNNKCYQSAAGLYDISVTAKFLARHKARGFSLQSLCLALHSGIMFNPETGARLPTFILRNPASLNDPEPNRSDLTNEIPLSAPRCFARGTPLTDCKLRFDPLTGRPLARALAARYQALGKQAIDFMRARLTEGRYQEPCSAVPENCSGTEDCDKRIERAEYCVVEKDNDGWLNGENVALKPQPAAAMDVIRLYDVSQAFPAGFGYALYQPKSGGAPDPNAQSLRRSTKPSSYQSPAVVKTLMARVADDR